MTAYLMVVGVWVVVVEIEVEEKTKLKLMIRQEGSLEVFVGC
jgi:hypothetical protein